MDNLKLSGVNQVEEEENDLENLTLEEDDLFIGKNASFLAENDLNIIGDDSIIDDILGNDYISEQEDIQYTSDALHIDEETARQEKNVISAENKETEPLKAVAAEFEKTDDLGVALFDFYYAISADGKTTIDDRNAFMNFLENKGKVGDVFFIFDENGNLPFCVKKEKDGFTVSEERISAQNQLEGPTYEPKKSIAISDIIKPTRRMYQKDILADKKKEAKKIKEAPDSYVQSYREKLETYKEEREKQIRAQIAEEKNISVENFAKKPDEFTEEKPALSAAAKVQRFFFKLITIGFGETKKYKELQEQLREYHKKEENYNSLLETYKAECGEIEKRMNIKDDKQLRLEEDLQKATNRADNIENELKDIEDKQEYYNKQAPIDDMKEFGRLTTYHLQKEVIMEGLADINKRGQLTQDNLFANIWALKQSVDKKDPSHLNSEEYKNLASYVACKMAENTIYHNFIHNPDYAEGQMNSTVLQPINSGAATEAMMKNPFFVNELRKLSTEGKPINAERFARDIETKMNAEYKKQNDPLERLKAERKAMEERFGRQPITEDVILDYARYRVLSEKIDAFQKIKNEGRPFSKQAMNDVRELIRDIHLNPNEEIKKLFKNGQNLSMEMPMVYDNIRRYSEQDYKDALKNVISRQEETKKITNNLVNSVNKNERRLLDGLNTDGKYTLPEIASFITSEHENMLKKAMNNGPMKK